MGREIHKIPKCYMLVSCGQAAGLLTTDFANPKYTRQTSKIQKCKIQNISFARVVSCCQAAGLPTTAAAAAADAVVRSQIAPFHPTRPTIIIVIITMIIIVIITMIIIVIIIIIIVVAIFK